MFACGKYTRCLNDASWQIEATLPNNSNMEISWKTQKVNSKTLIIRQFLYTYKAHILNMKHVVNEDLLEALNSEQLRGATLDVFSEEPLPQVHPYWSHEKVTLTPHCAAISDLESVSLQIAGNAKRLTEGKELINQIDRTKGY